MTEHIQIEDAQAWVEESKLGPSFSVLVDTLESQVSAELFSQLNSSFDTTSWTDFSTTPLLVKRIISMRYVAWTYNKLYSDNDDLSAYAALLFQNADALLAGIISGTLPLPDVPTGSVTDNRLPGYYPTDESSMMCPTYDDPSLGGPKFSMGRQW